MILLVCDNASWHKSNELTVYKNIAMAFIPPYTPEMNPIEQIWAEIRKLGFKNVALILSMLFLINCVRLSTGYLSLLLIVLLLENGLLSVILK